jgi:hypothetical protein
VAPKAIADALAGAALDAAELLDVDVQQLAGVAALVAIGRLGGSSRPSLPSPTLPSTAETVGSAIAKQKAISAPVIRNRRKTTITSTRSSLVRCGIEEGADERSSNPASPSDR